ncbi:MAG TPA: AAA family ATPase [Miltoncostaeaceae bacterium]|nr:AAA family ATPase [Miltoncostaeaceae bacterium]
MTLRARIVRGAVAGLLAALMLCGLALAAPERDPSAATTPVSITRALGLLSSGRADHATVSTGSPAELVVVMPNGRRFATTLPVPVLVERALDAATKGGVALETAAPEPAPEVTPVSIDSGGGFDVADFVRTWGGFFLIVVLVALLVIAIRQTGGARFGHRVKPVRSTTHFEDVAGIDEIRDEVIEIAEYLRSPERFERMGAELPKGIVLFGPPGTGKTLLARAVAGEAEVPFFSASGSEFVEVYVGLGARRIRSLFAAARKSAPAVIYIDEIDAIGERRSSGSGDGGQREHTATLDQLLTEMDGFRTDPGKPVVVLASTNRLEHLDPALVRAGRFDRKIAVGLPDRHARQLILGVHMRSRPIAPGLELASVAAFTAGLAGADLAALCNEASFEAARAGRDAIQMEDFRRALMRLAAGPERRTRILSDEERTLVAYHEMGHAIVGHLLPGCEPVDRVTIIPQGQALGVTVSLPEEDRFLATRQEYLDRLARIMGGRAAEELVFGEMTSGAADDLARATQLARVMVAELGMARASTEASLAAGLTGGSSEERVDGEIQALLGAGFRTAHELLAENIKLLHRAADTLLEAEALDREEIEAVLGPRPRSPRLSRLSDGAPEV